MARAWKVRLSPPSQSPQAPQGTCIAEVRLDHLLGPPPRAIGLCHRSRGRERPAGRAHTPTRVPPPPSGAITGGRPHAPRWPGACRAPTAGQVLWPALWLTRPARLSPSPSCGADKLWLRRTSHGVTEPHRGATTISNIQRAPFRDTRSSSGRQRAGVAANDFAFVFPPRLPAATRKRVLIPRLTHE